MSSRRWLKEHFTDPYVKEAQRLGYPSRATFKLLELDEKDKLLRKGMTVVDLGAAPGGWSMVARDKVGPKGMVVALDLLPLTISGVEFIQGDFTDDQIYHQLKELIKNRPIDLVLSDMAPNISGNKSIDQPRSMYLAELALDFAKESLKPGGDFLIKLFQGADVDQFGKAVKACFDVVKWRKPAASRPRSREVYLLGRGFKG